MMLKLYQDGLYKSLLFFYEFEPELAPTIKINMRLCFNEQLKWLLLPQFLSLMKLQVLEVVEFVIKENLNHCQIEFNPFFSSTFKLVV